MVYIVYAFYSFKSLYLMNGNDKNLVCSEFMVLNKLFLREMGQCI